MWGSVCERPDSGERGMQPRERRLKEFDSGARRGRENLLEIRAS
jgi:hypothetical protein